MSEETKEVFKAIKEHNKKSKAQFRENAPRILDENNINYSSSNKGAHLIVEGCECLIDFWPGTGKWIARNGERGFGISKLVEYIKT